MAKFAVILPAAGRSSRFKDKNYKKPFCPLANKAVWLHSADRFLARDDVVQTILVISPEDREDFNSKFSANIAILGIEVVDGGAERADSVQAALARVKPQADFVCIHDAARPCICDEWIDQIFSAAEKPARPFLPFPLPARLNGWERITKSKKPSPAAKSLGSANPAGLPPRLILDAYAKRQGLQRHRRRATGRADRP